jgi:hypothetical protein
LCLFLGLFFKTVKNQNPAPSSAPGPYLGIFGIGIKAAKPVITRRLFKETLKSLSGEALARMQGHKPQRTPLKQEFSQVLAERQQKKP